MKCQNKVLLLIISYLLAVQGGKAQVILNGNFENTLATSCVLNPSPSVFDSLMPHLHFHSDYITGIDIMSNSCFNSEGPHSGNWCLTLGNYWAHSELLVMELSQPLIVGNVYRLDFWLNPDSDFAAAYSDSLWIGITTDTAVFGTLLQKYLTAPDMWTNLVLDFTATIPATHITAEAIDERPSNVWLFIDDFVLSDITTSVTPLDGNDGVTFYPNPVKSIGTLQIEKGISDLSIEIFDIKGVLINRINREYIEREDIDFTNLLSGIYMMRLTSKNNTTILKIIKE